MLRVFCLAAVILTATPVGHSQSDATAPWPEGLLRSDERDHARGSEIVLAVLRSTGYFQGVWALGNGVAAVQMLECSVLDRLAYTSLFMSAASGSKLLSNAIGDTGLLVDYTFGPDGGTYPSRESSSIVFQRESILTAIAEGVRARFVYDSEGNWGRVYSPDESRSAEALTQTFQAGLGLLRVLRSNGYDDLTLRDSLGMVFAVLEFDRPTDHGISLIDLTLLGPSQIYRDTLGGLLGRLREDVDHSVNLLEELEIQMSARGLQTSEIFLFPDLEHLEQHDALLQILASELRQIRSVQ